MENNDEKSSLLQDVGLLLFLSLFSATAILMALTGNILLNVIYLFCTVRLLMITYFFGILPSLISNIVFIALQAVIMDVSICESNDADTLAIKLLDDYTNVIVFGTLFNDEESNSTSKV